MSLSRNHARYEFRIHFEYNHKYTGLGTVPDSVVTHFPAASYVGAMRKASTLVTEIERDYKQHAEYISMTGVTLKVVEGVN